MTFTYEPVYDPIARVTKYKKVDTSTPPPTSVIVNYPPPATTSSASAAAGTLTGTTLASGVTASSLTSFGASIALGTPASGVATNITGTAASLTAGHVTTNANLTGDVTSSGNATTLTNAPVIAKVLTGYTSGAGTVACTDTILQAIQKLNGNIVHASVEFAFAASDETTALTTGTKVTFHIPYAFTLTSAIGTLTTAQSAGSIFTFNIKKAGTTIFSTTPTIDNTETSTVTAATPAAISTTSFAADDVITITIDQVGTSGATGLKVWMLGTR